MKSIKLKYIVFAFLIVIAGCRKDEKTERQVIEDPTGDPTIEVVSGVTGLVIDEDNNPISNAAVSVYNKEVTTDENGIFYINNEGLKETNSTVKVQQAEYFDGFKTFIPAVGQKSFVQLQMVRKGSPKNILSTEGGSVDINGGAELILSANSVVVKDGGANYSGEISVFTHWYDPTDPDLGLVMPGNLLGITTEDGEVQLGTYGMIAVELESANGISLQLADNEKATLRFPVPENLDPPETIPLWSFDESDGVWVEEGTANLVDQFYIAEVSHFSFWNCDVAFPLVNIEGRLINRGEPVANYQMIITTDNLISGYGSTDSEGYFRGKVPKGEFLLLSSRKCDATVFNKELGVLEEDTNLGDIEVNIENFVTIIKGRMVGCTNTPLQSAYGLLRSGEDVIQVVTPIANGTDADGTFSTIISGCQNGNYSIQFFDPENIKNTDIIDISIDIQTVDLMDVWICDDLDEFIQFSIDEEPQPLLTEANVYFSNGEKLIIHGFENSYKFIIDIFASTDGKYNPSNVYIRGYGPTVRPSCGDIIQNVVGCEEFEVSISSFTDYVSGTFQGTLISRWDSLFVEPVEYIEHNVKGSFRVKIDESITTGEISGQLWVDENGNNTREDDEDVSTNPQNLRLVNIFGGGLNLFPNYITVYERFYTFTNLLPGTYAVRANGSSEYDLVNNDIGNDDRDSDFLDFADYYGTNELIINQDEVIENVDLGFVIPDSVICGDLFSTGCAPNIKLLLAISGGVPPYTASLNGEQTMMFDQIPIYNVSTGGNYTIKVTDALNHMCMSEKFVYSYNNEIFGRVWRDLDGGTPDVFDGNDETLSEITITLLDESGEFVTEELTNNSGVYTFNNVAPGIYFIEIVEIGSLLIVGQNTGISNGNDINPDTGRSNEFTVAGCNSKVRIDAGLK